MTLSTPESCGRGQDCQKTPQISNTCSCISKKREEENLSHGYVVYKATSKTVNLMVFRERVRALGLSQY